MKMIQPKKVGTYAENFGGKRTKATNKTIETAPLGSDKK